MWLLVIEVIAAIIAAARGWGVKPFILLGGTMLLGFFLGVMVGPDVIGFMQFIDYAVAVILIIMAVVSPKKQDQQLLEYSTPAGGANRIKCPQCAELIMADAKVCRYCGYQLVKKENT